MLISNARARPPHVAVAPSGGFVASVARKVCSRRVPGPALTRARPIYCMCVLLMHPRESRPSSSVRALHTQLAGASADSHILCAPSPHPALPYARHVTADARMPQSLTFLRPWARQLRAGLRRGHRLRCRCAAAAGLSRFGGRFASGSTTPAGAWWRSGSSRLSICPSLSSLVHSKDFEH